MSSLYPELPVPVDIEIPESGAPDWRVGALCHPEHIRLDPAYTSDVTDDLGQR